MSKHHYVMPMVGTIFPAKENTDIVNPGTYATAERRAQFNQEEAQNEAYKANVLLEEDWLAEGGGWGRWIENYKTGRLVGPKGPGDPDAPPPFAPMAKQVVVTLEEDESINFEVVDSATPVCPTPEYVKIPPPAHYPPAAPAPNKSAKKH